MLCCLKFLYGGTTSNSNIAMKLNQSNIQLDTANMGMESMHIHEKFVFEFIDLFFLFLVFDYGF